MSTAQQPGSQGVHDVHEVAGTPTAPATARAAAPARHPRRSKRSPAAAVALGARRTVWALLIVLLLAGAGLVTYSILSGKWTIAPVLSGSMQPGFPVGGVVVAERHPTSELAVGDVIIFQDPDRPSDQVVHRIIQLESDQSGRPVIKTKGDANNADDPWTVSLLADSVYVAQFTLPLLGYAAVNTSRGINLMIAGVILLLIVLSTAMSRGRRDATGQASIPAT